MKYVGFWPDVTRFAMKFRVQGYLCSDFGIRAKSDSREWVSGHLHEDEEITGLLGVNGLFYGLI